MPMPMPMTEESVEQKVKQRSVTDVMSYLEEISEASPGQKGGAMTTNIENRSLNTLFTWDHASRRPCL